MSAKYLVIIYNPDFTGLNGVETKIIAAGSPESAVKEYVLNDKSGTVSSLLLGTKSIILYHDQGQQEHKVRLTKEFLDKSLDEMDSDEPDSMKFLEDNVDDLVAILMAFNETEYFRINEI